MNKKRQSAGKFLRESEGREKKLLGELYTYLVNNLPKLDKMRKKASRKNATKNRKNATNFSDRERVGGVIIVENINN